MKLPASLSARKIVRAFSVCLTSIYLTFLVDIYTLNTTTKRIFVFCYFVAVCLLLSFLKRRFVLEKRKIARRKFSRALTVFLSFCVLIGWQDFFLPCDTPVRLSIEADGTGEVWMTSVEVNGQEIPLENLQLIANVRWQYNSEYDDYVYYPDTLSPSNCLQIETAGQEVCLHFAKNSWSGSVLIQVEGQADVRMELYTDRTEEDDSVYRGQIGKNYSSWERVLLNFGVLGILAFFLEFVSIWIIGRVDMHGIRMFFGSALNDERKKTKFSKLLHGVLAAVFLFMFCGQKLILDNYSTGKFILFIVGLIPAYIFCVVMLYALDSIRKNVLHKRHIADQNSGSSVETPVALRTMSAVLALLLTIPTLLFVGNTVLRPRQAGQVQILPLNQNGAYSDAAEVWLLDVVMDGEHLDLQTLELPRGWTFNEDGKIIFLPSEDAKPEPLAVPYSAASHVYIKFLHHAWSGLVLIVDGEKREQIDLSDRTTSYYYEVTGNRAPVTAGLILEYCITAVVLFFSFGTIVYFLYKRMFATVNGYRQRSWIFLFLTALFVFSLYLIICRPGFLNKDATVQWSQALGLTRLTNGHPIASTLFWRLCSRIIPSLTFVVFLQSVIIAAVLASCFMILIDHGMRRKYVVVSLAVLAALPNHALLAISATKDGVYCAFLLLMGVSLYSIIYAKRRTAVLEFVLSVVMVCLFRHEGFAIVFLSGIVLLILSFIKKKILPGIITLSCAIMLTVGISGTLSNMYLKNTGASGGSSIFAHLILGVHARDGEVGAAGEKYLETYAGDIPITDLEALFDPYNADTIGWSVYHDQLSKNTVRLSRADEVAALLDCLRHSPLLTIKLKLAENNQLWNFFQSSDSWHDLGGWVYFPELGDEFGFETLRGSCAPIMQSAIDATKKNPIINAILWRGGFAAFAWMLLAVYAIEKRRFRDMLLSIPLMLQWGVLMMVLQFQVYRYLWIALMAVSLQLMFLMESNKNETGDV